MSTWPPSPGEPDRPEPPAAPPPPQPYPPQPPQYPPQPPYQQGYPPYQQYPPAPGYQPQTYNAFAITSMVLGIIWIYWIGSILALIFGYIAKGQIKQRNQLGGGMATAGIVLGWVGVGTLTLMIIFIIIDAANGGLDSSLNMIRPVP
ncbi:MAG: DUF4190 domain-containing protein [Acidimicrobiales bacterium]